MKKYYNKIEVSVPVKIYQKRGINYEKLNDLIYMKHGAYFNEEDFDVELNEVTETSGYLIMVFRGLTPCLKENCATESFGMETVPDFLDKAYGNYWSAIEKELSENNIYIEDIDFLDLFIEYGEANKLSLDDLFLFKGDGGYDYGVPIDVSDPLLKKIKENIDDYLTEAYLVTGNKNFIKNVPDAKEKAKRIIEALNDIKLTKTDIAKAVEYVNASPEEILFLEDETLKKTALSLKLASLKDKEKNKNPQKKNDLSI